MSNLFPQNVRDRLLCEFRGLFERKIFLAVGFIYSEGVAHVFTKASRLRLPVELARLGVLRVEVVVDVVYDLVVLADVWYDVDVEIAFVDDHVSTDLFQCECYWFLNLLEVLQLFDLIVRELIFSGDEDRFITEEFLSLFLRNYLFGSLL